jgi:hypothetical protein
MISCLTTPNPLLKQEGANKKLDYLISTSLGGNMIVSEKAPACFRRGLGVVGRCPWSNGGIRDDFN